MVYDCPGAEGQKIIITRKFTFQKLEKSMFKVLIRKNVQEPDTFNLI